MDHIDDAEEYEKGVGMSFAKQNSTMSAFGKL